MNGGAASLFLPVTMLPVSLSTLGLACCHCFVLFCSSLSVDTRLLNFTSHRHVIRLECGLFLSRLYHKGEHLNHSLVFDLANPIGYVHVPVPRASVFICAFLYEALLHIFNI